MNQRNVTLKSTLKREDIKIVRGELQGFTNEHIALPMDTSLSKLLPVLFPLKAVFLLQVSVCLAALHSRLMMLLHSGWDASGTRRQINDGDRCACSSLLTEILSSV